MSDENITQQSALVPATSAVTAPENISVSAVSADEMGKCQNALVMWAKAKLSELHVELHELTEARDSAIKNKWGSGTLSRQVVKAEKRIVFYDKLLSALDHGYTIVPNFPVTAFAIRTDRKNPAALYTTSYNQSHTQKCVGLPQGEGEYKNPFPVVCQESISPATATKGETVSYWADSWKELEFPITMAKAQLVEATTDAMKLKVFDEIGILPGYAPGEGTRPPKGDPLIIARIFDPTRSTQWDRHYVSFIICWHLNTKDL